MNYLVLARKWRPKGFDGLVGQEPIATVLKNAVSGGKVAHAYVFSGPRGVGKTSTARILAKALNCKEGPTPTPCGVCDSCREITEGYSVDVMEIDGASNNSVDDIRDLREKVRYAPSGGKYKVYIIDEAHMLSTSAFNALLKTIEEPPPHVVFVLATTASQKIPPTVMSRCQHLPFRRIPTSKIKDRLSFITKNENMNISEGALEMIASTAEGGMRDALTILDQAASFSTEIDEQTIIDLLGLTGFETLASLSKAVLEGDRPRIMSLINELTDKGTDVKSFTKDLVKFFRDLLAASVVSSPEEIIEYGPEDIAAIKGIVERYPEDILTLFLGEMVKAEQSVRSSFSPRLVLEMSLIRASFLSTLRSVNDAIKNIEAFGSGSSGSGSSGSVSGSGASTGGVASVSNRPRQQPKSKDKDADDDKASAKATEPAPDDKESDDAPGVSGVVVALTAETLFNRIINKLENQKDAAKLSKAKPSLDSGILTLTFTPSEAELFSDLLSDKAAEIAAMATEIAGQPVAVEIRTGKKKAAVRKKDLKEKVMSEPVIKDALELFEGRIVDVKNI